MSETGISLSNFSPSQLSDILRAAIGETEIMCSLYNSSGELLLSVPNANKQKDTSPLTRWSEIREIVHQAALSALKGELTSRLPEAQCLTEIILYQGKVQGVIVNWIGKLTSEPDVSLLCEAITRTTKQRIEELFDRQKESDSLCTEIIENHRELGLIHTLNTELAGLADMDEVYRLVLKQVVQMARANWGGIFQLDASTDELRLVQSVPEMIADSPQPTVKIGEGLIGSMAQTEASILIEDEGHPLWDSQSYYPFSPPLMGCALLIGQTLLGVIVVTRESTESAFESGDLKLLKSAAVQSASAIMNVKLLEDLSQTNQELQREATERKRAEAQLRYITLHDTLTGIPNRTLFLDRLSQAVERAKRRKGYLFAVLFFSLSRLKSINDSLGHSIGDRLLIEFIQRIKKILRSEDTVGRFGGEEFAVLLDDIKDISDATHIAERMHKELLSPFNVLGHEIYATTHIGISLSNRHETSPELLIRNANLAMSQAKASDIPYEVFDISMHAHAVTRLQLETDLHRAVERRELRLHYQPIISLETGKITSFEALLRWQHPTYGLIYPTDLIPMAEESNFIVTIDQWVLREACHQIRIWQTQYPTDPLLAINVNLSAKQCMHPDLTAQVAQILQETQISPSCLNLEIPESVIIENTEFVTTIFPKLDALNVRLQMGNFGVGYSFFRFLHHLPIDTLKIDRSLISNIGADRQNLAIIQAIVALADHIGVEVTAEGMETEDQLLQLKELGCRTGQGYYFSNAVDAQTATALIKKDHMDKGLWKDGI